MIELLTLTLTAKTTASLQPSWNRPNQRDAFRDKRADTRLAEAGGDNMVNNPIQYCSAGEQADPYHVEQG